MTEYSVEITDSALAAVSEQARYIAVDANAPMNAQRWLESMWDAIASLELLPHRGSLAAENDYVEEEVRQLVVGNHLLLYSVDDDRRTVWILGLRRGQQLPRPEDLGEPGG